MSKTFIKENAALMFISEVNKEPEADIILEAKEPEPKKKTASKKKGHATFQIEIPEKKEAKSRRLQLLIQPSLYNKVKAAADNAGLSVNDYIHTILEIATREG